MDGVVDDLLANRTIGGVVEWTKTGHNVVIAVIGLLVLLRLIGFVGAYCSNCGSREKQQHAGASVLATLTKSLLGGAFSFEEGHTCARCGEFWNPSGFWKALGALIALVALGMAFLVYKSVDRDRSTDPTTIYDRDYGR